LYLPKVHNVTFGYITVHRATKSHYGTRRLRSRTARCQVIAWRITGELWHMSRLCTLYTLCVHFVVSSMHALKSVLL